ncbi:hypothetical protein GGF46_005243, partial [Coemansia sp. RSA 552]
NCIPAFTDEKVVLYFHGGGYCTGSTGAYRELLCRVSERAGVRVISIDYRLAPEHPFPAQVHDALVAYECLVQRGFGAHRIVVGGDGAGAHLALSLTHLLRHIQRPLPGGLILLSPMPDMANDSPSHMRFQAFDYLHMQPVASPMSYSRVLYAPGEPLTERMREELEDPLVSPINGNFYGFPPTLIQAGDKEVLHDDIQYLVEAMTRQNVHPPRVGVYQDMVHVFQLFMDRDESTAAVNQIGRFVARI